MFENLSKNIRLNILEFGANSGRKLVLFSDYFWYQTSIIYICEPIYQYTYLYAPIDPCLEVNCGKHSKCQVEGTEAFCVCDEGWTYNPKEISAGCVGKLILNRIWCMPPPYTSSAAYM